ncbi:unnamed protein product [Haemonchus placei]|uniref:Expressed conserved protein n=1 Tax=Haemonchus placei TaxID=6290 RepID=A0A0N4VT15_HAEPC|nr:unnamed protein product [Haemonchus placei]
MGLFDIMKLCQRCISKKFNRVQSREEVAAVGTNGKRISITTAVIDCALELQNHYQPAALGHLYVKDVCLYHFKHAILCKCCSVDALFTMLLSMPNGIAQKGLATGHIKGNENPSQLKNSVIVMQRDHMFITDDQAAKQSLLRHLQRGHFDAPEEMYWSKSNGNQSSCTTRKLPLNDSAMNTPETSRLIQRPVEDTVAYNSVSHYQQEAYASIHKAKEQALYQRRDSADNSHYGKIENNYSNYGTYSRLPPQVQQAQRGSTIRIFSLFYSHVYQYLGFFAFRDQSPYHRSAIKLTSFDTSDKGGVYGSVPSQWTTQRAPPGQPGQPSYNSNKVVIK